MEHVEDRILAAAVKRLHSLQLKDCFNPDLPDAQPSPKQLEVLMDTTHRYIYVVAANRAGKSQIGARIISWWLSEQHPYMKRPKEWGDGPLTLIVMGRTRRQVEEELWSNKIKRYLEPGTYQEVRIASSLEKVVHDNGNKLLLMSHNDPAAARQNVQSYTCHVILLDEMPKDVELFTELQMRVWSNQGRFITTFTPLVISDQIREMIDTATEPIAKRYRFSMYDNPLNATRSKEEIDALLAGCTPEERAAREFGEWYRGSARVFSVEPRHIKAPVDYYSGWSHVEVVDPAASSKFGLLLAAQQPGTSNWYIVSDHLLDGEAPTVLLDQVEQLTSGKNIVKRIADGHEVWWIKEARRRQRTYTAVDKNNRKLELITGLQQALLDGWLKIAPWCTGLLKELDSAQWADGKQDTIVNHSRLHLIDCLEYFVDARPKDVIAPRLQSPHELLQEANDKRLRNEARKADRYRITTRRHRRWA